MLFVRTRVGKSAIHGLGLFAEEFIAKGTLIWRFQPGFDVEIAEDDVALLSPSARQQVFHYAEYFPAERKFWLSSDDDRFCNHAEDPNLITRGKEMFAVRDIKVGEEITCSYRECIVMSFRPEIAA